MSGEFAREVSQRANALRDLPRALSQDMHRIDREVLAEPLARELRAAGTRSVYARMVARTVKVVGSRPIAVEIGGPQRIASGGATGTDLLYGTEFGGGRRTGHVRTSRRARGHRRRTTRQFLRQRAPFIERTVEQAQADLLEPLDKAITARIEQVTR